MATLRRAILGAAYAALSAASSQPRIDPGYHNGRIARLAMDYYTGDAAQNDVLVLAEDLKWDTLLDDLSSALDVETEVQLWTNLAEAGITVLAVSHRAVAFERAHQVLVLDAGRLVRSD